MATENRTLPFAAVVDAVEIERRFQDGKWGPIETNPHTLAGWLLLMRKELDEAEMALIKGGTGRDAVMQEILQEILQVVALGAAAIEQHGVDGNPRSL